MQNSLSKLLIKISFASDIEWEKRIKISFIKLKGFNDDKREKDCRYNLFMNENASRDFVIKAWKMYSPLSVVLFIFFDVVLLSSIPTNIIPQKRLLVSGERERKDSFVKVKRISKWQNYNNNRKCHTKIFLFSICHDNFYPSLLLLQ